MNVKQMLEEEKALEEKMFGTPSDGSSNPEEATTVEAEDNSALPKEDGADTPEAKAVEPEAKPEEDWEKRYKNLRASREQKLYDTQKSLADNQTLITNLQQRIDELEKLNVPVEVSVRDSLSEEEIDTLGDTAVSAVEKAVKAVSASKIDSLQEELKGIREANAQAAKDRAKLEADNAYGTFLSRLQNVVPEYESLNTDGNFLKYLEDSDIDGSIRFDNFRNAERRGDVASVSRYMKDYLATKPIPKEDKLEHMVTPKQAASPATTTTGKDDDFLTRKQVNAHYDKHARGGYKGKEKEFLDMELKIDQYFSEGKIRG